MQAPEIESALNETRNQARLLGINGTPGLIIDNQLVGSQMPYEQLLATVDAAAKNSR
jgi:protein-disulfide isomerase